MQPTTAYLDANILTAIAPGDLDWTESEWGSYLTNLTGEQKLEVWASPGNCLELALVPDISQRNSMAKALNTLSRGYCMLPAYEFFVVEDLLQHVERNWPGTFQTEYFERLKAKSAQTYIALLGQLAALPDYDCSRGFAGILKPKIISQLIQDSILDNPKSELEKRLKALQTHDFRPKDIFAEYDDKSLAELQALSQALKNKKYSVDKKAVMFLKKHKADFINGYALAEVYSAMEEVFSFMEELLQTVKNFHALVAAWDRIYDLESQGNPKYRVKPLPAEVVQRFATNSARLTDCRIVMRALALRFYRFLAVPQIYNSTIFNELEQALNHGKLPTWGLTLDSQHAVGAMYAEFFLTNDGKLLNTVKQWYTQIRAEAGYREAVDSLKDFKNKAEKRIRDLEATT